MIEAAEPQTVKEVAFAAPNEVTMKLRMEGPTTADVPLQVVCYFKYTAEGVKRMTGARSSWTKTWAASSARCASGASSSATSWRRC